MVTNQLQNFSASFLLVVPMILYKSLVVPMAICMLGLEFICDNVMTMWLWMCQRQRGSWMSFFLHCSLYIELWIFIYFALTIRWNTFFKSPKILVNCLVSNLQFQGKKMFLQNLPPFMGHHILWMCGNGIGSVRSYYYTFAL
jgi:hypothetical protein